VGLVAAKVDWNSVEYFGLPPKKKRVPLNFKVPPELKTKLQGAVRLWKAMARSKGASEDEIQDIDFTYVCERFLEIGVDGLWGEAGKALDLQGMPQNEQEWVAFERALVKDAKKNNR
jgi:hypothetical protein